MEALMKEFQDNLVCKTLVALHGEYNFHTYVLIRFQTGKEETEACLECNFRKEKNWQSSCGMKLIGRDLN